ncbi:MAG: hypothetical protein NWE84_07540 [Candidatus Bathyarchaeota archaeon]|nr:hypothetical protein [Candidatus Bathyarchaeota archaeon]
MSLTRKEKLEANTDASLQIVTENSAEESAVIVPNDYIEVALRKRKEEADKPLYLKRI